MSDPIVYVPLILIVMLITGLAIVAYLSRRSRILRRVGVRENDFVEAGERASVDQDESALHRWLYLAGYRHPQAEVVYLGVQVLFLVFGVGLAMVATAAGVFVEMAYGIEQIPGEFAQVLIPLMAVVPWALAAFIAAIPWLFVQKRRREIARDIEAELPIILELLATLAEAGMGFDSAITRMLESDQGTGRLADEFRMFQRESLAGVPRVRCLRRLAQRVDVPTFSTFISSLIQAERGGFGLSNVLRNQADDLRNRRKENALMRAQALPVKLVFPLVICFLPGLFVLTLGPAFYTFFQLADQVIGAR